MPNAMRLPSSATRRPLDFAGLSSLTHRAVIAVLKPLPQPLHRVSKETTKPVGENHQTMRPTSS